MANVVKLFVHKWKSYRYRFLPWIALNLKNRSVRAVPHASMDKLLLDIVIENSLLRFFNALESVTVNGILPVAKPPAYKPYVQELHLEQEPQLCYPCSSRANSGDVTGIHAVSVREVGNHQKKHYDAVNLQDTSLEQCGSDCVLPQSYSPGFRAALDVMHSVLGFTIEKQPSYLIDGGTGVVVTRGTIPKDTVLAMYPGTVYCVNEPIFLQSIGNSFIFRCLDGILVDGNDKRISRMIYRSCAQRERIGPYMTSDLSWLSASPDNPMAIGQYINNHTKEYPANVDYQEFDVPHSFPLHLRKYLPNIFYSTEHQYAADEDYDNRRLQRTVVLVSLRDIHQGEELLSSYFTTVVQ